MSRSSTHAARRSTALAVATLILALGLEAGRAAHDWSRSLPVLGEVPSADEEAAVMSLFRSFARAWSAGDAAGVAAAFEAELDWTNAFGRTLRTREQLEAYLRAQFAFPGDEGLAAGDLDAAREATLRYLGGDVAVLQWVSDGVGRGNGGGTHVTLIARKSGGDWRLVSHTATVLRD